MKKHNIPLKEIEKHIQDSGWNPKDPINNKKKIENLVHEIITKGVPKSNMNIIHALDIALNYSGPKGYIATLPELSLLKINNEKEDYFFPGFYTAHTEEHVGIDNEGRFYKRGEKVLTIIHGGGLITPSRIKESDIEIFKNELIKFDQNQFNELLKGNIGAKKNIKMIPYEEFHNINIQDHQYGVVLPLKEMLGEYISMTKNKFMSSPLMISRFGGDEFLEDFFDCSNINGHFIAHQTNFEKYSVNNGTLINYDPESSCLYPASKFNFGYFLSINPKKMNK